VVHTIKCVTEFLACKCESGALASSLLFLSHRGLKTPSRTTTWKTNCPPISLRVPKVQAVILLTYKPRSEGRNGVDPHRLKLDTDVEVSGQLHSVATLSGRKYCRVEY